MPVLKIDEHGRVTVDIVGVSQDTAKILFYLGAAEALAKKLARKPGKRGAIEPEMKPFMEEKIKKVMEDMIPMISFVPSADERNLLAEKVDSINRLMTEPGELKKRVSPKKAKVIPSAVVETAPTKKPFLKEKPE